MTPQKSPHAAAVTLVQEALRVVLGIGCHVRTQLPLALDPASEPEPDVAVVHGAPRDYRDAHPATALLLVEVADTTLAFDRGWKSSLYARAGVADYWIVNLVDRVLEVYRDRRPEPAARYGWTYATVRRFDSEEGIVPLAAPTARVAVRDLLP